MKFFKKLRKIIFKLEEVALEANSESCQISKMELFAKIVKN